MAWPVRKSVPYLAAVGGLVAACVAVRAWAQQTGRDHGARPCGVCHTLHDANDGRPDARDLTASTGESQTDLCLDCHADGPLASTWAAPVVARSVARQPGGDFAWLESSYGGGGHTLQSRRLLTRGGRRPWRPTPGGGVSTPAMETLSCVTCHDAHLDAGTRLLRGGRPGDVVRAPPPEVEWAELTGGEGGDNEGSGRRNGYRAGFDAWCGSCHGQVHLGDPHFEASGRGKTLSWQHARAYGLQYDPEVPFEDPAARRQSAAGPTAGVSRVFCLSCHRAHAGAFDHAGRFPLAGATQESPGCVRCHGNPAPAEMQRRALPAPRPPHDVGGRAAPLPTPTMPRAPWTPSATGRPTRR